MTFQKQSFPFQPQDHTSFVPLQTHSFTYTPSTTLQTNYEHNDIHSDVSDSGESSQESVVFDANDTNQASLQGNVKKQVSRKDRERARQRRRKRERRQRKREARRSVQGEQNHHHSSTNPEITFVPSDMGNDNSMTDFSGSNKTNSQLDGFVSPSLPFSSGFSTNTPPLTSVTSFMGFPEPRATQDTQPHNSPVAVPKVITFVPSNKVHIQATEISKSKDLTSAESQLIPAFDFAFPNTAGITDVRVGLRDFNTMEEDLDMYQSTRAVSPASNSSSLSISSSSEEDRHGVFHGVYEPYVTPHHLPNLHAFPSPTHTALTIPKLQPPRVPQDQRSVPAPRSTSLHPVPHPNTHSQREKKDTSPTSSPSDDPTAIHTLPTASNSRRERLSLSVGFPYSDSSVNGEDGDSNSDVFSFAHSLRTFASIPIDLIQNHPLRSSNPSPSMSFLSMDSFATSPTSFASLPLDLHSELNYASPSLNSFLPPYSSDSVSDTFSFEDSFESREHYSMFDFGDFSKPPENQPPPE
ncbi:hypothetical protein BLNAU_8986 [Blattamonas nauphoetae]|uniref:BZIP domain-containing protein n=1 Tax=Blattamonas nauphoetae TaxID=2049346 RepID=A0ABQ9XX02_9EUKA|nr:hypothetical protein BLNAU_8986 [Blattamonas nauphoetae]